MSLETSPSLAESTRGPLMVLRIIVAALAIGVTTFAAVAVSQNLGKPHVIAGKFDAQGMVFLAMGLIALPLGIILPRVIDAASRRTLPMNALPGMTPEQMRMFAIQQRIQMSAILACAVFEGAAFANTFGYMQSREVVHLALAGVLLVGILAHFPTASSYERRVDDELRRLRDEDGLIRNGL